MLVLNRRPGESLFLNDSIKITILSLQGKQVKIGLDVPKDMLVYRDELYQRVKEENKQALAANPSDITVTAYLWQRLMTKY